MRYYDRVLYCISIVIPCILLGVAGNLRAQVVFERTYGPTPYPQGKGYDDYFDAISCNGPNCTAAKMHEDWTVRQLTKRFERTTNAGLTWTEQDPHLPSHFGINSGQLEAVQQIDSLNVIAVGDSSIILRTFDGGATWIQQTGLDTCFFRCVHFSDPANGIVIGNTNSRIPVMLTTSDGGLHWTRTGFAVNAVFHCHTYANGRYAIFQGLYGNGKVFSTKDNWQTVDSTVAICDSINYYTFNAAISSGQNIIAYGRHWNGSALATYGVIVRSTDLGKHWEKPIAFDSSYSWYPNITCMSDIDHDTIVGGCGINGRTMNVVVSTDRGATWRVDSMHFDTIIETPTPAGFAVTTGGKVLGLFGTGLFGEMGFIARGHIVNPPVGVASHPASVAGGIYPNPASESVTISLADQSGTIRVVDLLGRDVLSGQLGAGGSVKLNVSGLARGVYEVMLDQGAGRRKVGKFAVM